MKEEQTTATLHVATDGDDSKDGSASSPLLTISRAADLPGRATPAWWPAASCREWGPPGRGRS